MRTGPAGGGSGGLCAAERAALARGRELLPGFRVFTTGTLVLLNRTSDRIASDQRHSITIALLAIFAMLALLFRSWRVGLTALVPNLTGLDRAIAAQSALKTTLAGAVVSLARARIRIAPAPLRKQKPKRTPLMPSLIPARALTTVRKHC